MRDVRGLLRMAKAAALALTAVLALLVVRYERLRRRIGQSDAARALLEGEWIGLGALGALIAALFIWAAVDFYSLFASFHRLVFTNENWLLDPQTDRLIRMMPQRLFETLWYNSLIDELIEQVRSGFLPGDRESDESYLDYAVRKIRLMGHSTLSVREKLRPLMSCGHADTFFRRLQNELYITLYASGIKQMKLEYADSQTYQLICWYSSGCLLYTSRCV